MKKLIVVAVVLLLAASSAFALTANYGWEDGNTVLGSYGTVLTTNVTSPVYSGSHSLQLVDNYSGSATPQAYVAWITGLATGDVVTASFWVYDTTPSSSPSGRIWGHYTSSLTDIDAYAGSASGSSSYGDGNGWSQLSYSWTFDASTDRNGLVIEARTYSDSLDTIWIDDLSIIAPDHATVITAGGVTSVPEPGSLIAILSGIVGLVGYMQKRR